MLYYALKRIGFAGLIVLLAMSLLFLMMHLVPGDPATVALGPRATPEMKALLNARLGLDKPLLIQLATFIGNAITGDLGLDVWSERPVIDIIGEQLPSTLALVAAAIGWAALVGIPLGCLAAVRRDSLFDRLTGLLSVSAIALPSFLVAIYALLFFAVTLRWFPAIGSGQAGNTLDQAHHLALPAFAIGLGWVGYLARIVRASMLEVLGENHIRTARAFGLPTRIITFRYALRIAILPTITLLGIAVGGLISGAMFAEIIFARPGIGKLVYDAVIMRNYPIVMGSVLVTTILFVTSTTIADLITAGLDPRVRQKL